ncbi:hypothetical protein [Aliidiomarina soli]|uniref:Uncharacterized protein n=1 Tax=Aliidiomarina soli TaxID=1928574 RepID=A0A432WE62_9GAMM|nr:hypothetical protein [Aliidiomarina soli]RUO31145.1 hypothetical protein CWE14_11665 [Aliidiomarina soli]
MPKLATAANPEEPSQSYAEGQQGIDGTLAATMNRGEQAYSKNEREQPFGYDVDLDSAIDFLQSERASAYTGLGLDLSAAEGG